MGLMFVMDPETELEYQAAIGAKRCTQCNELHLDDDPICWDCQTEEESK